MIDDFSLRPADFQKSWTTAYQLAMMQVAELQQKSDLQIGHMKMLMNSIESFNKVSRERLLESGTHMICTLNNSSQESQLQINQATTQLMTEINHLKFIQTQLLKDILQFEKQKIELKNMSFRNRLLFFFGLKS
jgi:hypothetical protein